MLQQIVVNPIRSRCTGFGLHDWQPQISQSERLVVNFSVIWGEVNFVLLLLLFYGLECSTVVGRGGIVCKCCCMLDGCIGWQLWDIFCPWLTFLLVEESTDFLKADRLSPLNSRLCRTILSRARLAFRASRYSSSNQGFDFLGMVVVLGMLSFVALVMCSTMDCKGSPSSRMSSVILSKHRSSNSSQSALENTQWEGSQLGCVSATGGRIDVSMG